VNSQRSLSTWVVERRRQAIIACLTVGLAIIVFLLISGDSAAAELAQGLSLSAIVAALAYLIGNY
jgi:hypothetical protein